MTSICKWPKSFHTEVNHNSHFGPQCETLLIQLVRLDEPFRLSVHRLKRGKCVFVVEFRSAFHISGPVPLQIPSRDPPPPGSPCIRRILRPSIALQSAPANPAPAPPSHRPPRSLLQSRGCSSNAPRPSACLIFFSRFGRAPGRLSQARHSARTR